MLVTQRFMEKKRKLTKYKFFFMLEKIVEGKESQKLQNFKKMLKIVPVSVSELKF